MMESWGTTDWRARKTVYGFGKVDVWFTRFGILWV